MSTHSSLFDASALVKVFSIEPGSNVVKQYFDACPCKYTTPFCFYEAMNALKGKWKYKQQLSLEEYYKATFELTAWHGKSVSHGIRLSKWLWLDRSAGY